ncbi:predicted protein, partial [Nematostella vectensis]
WPNAVIPYEFDCSIGNKQECLSTSQSMAEWESKTCIRFVKRTTETAYLSFFRGQGCWGHLGHTANYKSQISIGDNCDFQYVMSHEIGHSVGFWHEHNRPDRDNYIQVLWENVVDEFHDAFEKRKWGTEVTDYGSQYDFASIMHYPFTAFSKNGRPTIKAIADMQGKTPYVALSADDAMQTNAMYKCNGKCVCCADKQRECPDWARRGKCSKSGWTFRNCLISCKARCDTAPPKAPGG